MDLTPPNSRPSPPADGVGWLGHGIQPGRAVWLRWLTAWVLLLNAVATLPGQTSNDVKAAFVNFESAPVHPMDLSPDGKFLAVCNLADARLEVFDVSSGEPRLQGSVRVGLDPVSVRFQSNREAWVVNHISDSISIVDVTSLRVLGTVSTPDTPSDVVFAGVPLKAFVSCAQPNTLVVYDPDTRQSLTNVLIQAERPKALAVSPDRQKVYAAVFESGNGTTVVGPKFRNLLFIDNPVSLPQGPYAGQNPPPNDGGSFQPPLNPDLPGGLSIPPTGLIVRKNSQGQWMDDNQRDWTEFVSGTNSFLNRRIPGWDLPDRDLAVLDANDYSLTYATGLMNLCMALGVNPVTGDIAVVGTDAINEVRFEPNLNGIFVRVKLAMVNPMDLSRSVGDLNPHLDYTVSAVPAVIRNQSLGDPRAIVWRSDGTRCYVAGMGSRNLAVLNQDGQRLSAQPLEMGEGPCGLVLDEARERLYVFNRFSSSISVVDTSTETVISSVSLFDPTPLAVAAGRRHLYDTRHTSGLGQASCASCHVDARFDRLGWDLGNPAGAADVSLVNLQGNLVTNVYHPMKGVMVTQTLQDIIGHEPFHWRGDRPGIESFNPTYTNLQAAAQALSEPQMTELRDFLSSIRFPPNPFRPLDNSLPTQLPLPGHYALGEHILPAGAPLPAGDAVAGLSVFNAPGNFCVTCHTLPTGLGLDQARVDGVLQPIPAGSNKQSHLPLASRLEGTLPSKISQFRNMADRVGMDVTSLESRAGFGFGHDGSIDSMTRFLLGVRLVTDQDIANAIAFLLSVAGSDTRMEGALPDPTPPSAVGRQLTLFAPAPMPLLQEMMTLARQPSSRIELVAHGSMLNEARGWLFDPVQDQFQSDRTGELETLDGLVAWASPSSAMTFMVVPLGSGRRLGLDRDGDGMLDGDERDAGTNPADRRLFPEILAAGPGLRVAAATDMVLQARIPPLPAPGVISWHRDGQMIPGADSSSLLLTNIAFASSGDFQVVVTTPFLNLTSPPVNLMVEPLLVEVSPDRLVTFQGSNVLFTALVEGAGPFEYQWQWQGADLVGASDSVLTLTNVLVAQEGEYQVRVTGALGTMTSQPATLGVWLPPALLLPPLSQRVVEGGQAIFSFQIVGNPPPFGFQLRRGFVPMTHYISDQREGFFSLFPVQTDQAGLYRILITNAANPSPGLLVGPVELTVLPDTDQDGMPDEWEDLHGLDKNDGLDAMQDEDGDGQSNGEEYQAATDPRDALSVLKMERIQVGNDGENTSVRVEFWSASNRTYTLESRLETGQGAWERVRDVVARPEAGWITITNSVPAGMGRFYRLRTPRGAIP